MSPAELFSSISSSGAGAKLLGIITAIGGLAAIYKFFIEFVEPNEQAVRAWNNKPDFHRKKIRKRRKFVIITGVVGALTSIVLMFATSFDRWLLLAGVVVLLFIAATALIRWPRTNDMALIKPGIKCKIPGLISYKKGSIAIDTRTVLIDDTVDGTQALVNLGLRYRWSRTRNSARAQWRSNVRVSNLEVSQDEEIKSVAMIELLDTKDAAALSSDELDQLCAKVLETCQRTFKYKFGTKIFELWPTRLGVPAQVAGATVIGDALKEGHITIN